MGKSIIRKPYYRFLREKDYKDFIMEKLSENQLKEMRVLLYLDIKNNIASMEQYYYENMEDLFNRRAFCYVDCETKALFGSFNLHDYEIYDYFRLQNGLEPLEAID